MSGLTGNEAHIMQTRTRKGIRLTDNHDPKRTIARPDSDIARDVARATKTNAQKPDAGIKAIVSDGFVTLEGTAEWDFERRGLGGVGGGKGRKEKDHVTRTDRKSG
jgi:osmotically-inducible protein OsmY